MGKEEKRERVFAPTQKLLRKQNKQIPFSYYLVLRSPFGRGFEACSDWFSQICYKTDLFFLLDVFRKIGKINT